jgi:hypothetical protein
MFPQLEIYLGLGIYPRLGFYPWLDWSLCQIGLSVKLDLRLGMYLRLGFLRLLIFILGSDLFKE